MKIGQIQAGRTGMGWGRGRRQENQETTAIVLATEAEGLN